MTKTETTVEPADSERAAIRDISAAQLAQLGLLQLAYIRPVMMDGALAYAIHGADGAPMAVAPDRDRAAAAIEDHDLMQVPVH